MKRHHSERSAWVVAAVVAAASTVVGCGRDPAPPAASPAADRPTKPHEPPAPRPAEPVRTAAATPAPPPAAAAAEAKAAIATTEAALALRWQRLGLRLPPSHATQHFALDAADRAADAGVLVVSPQGLRVDGVEVGAVACRTARGACAQDSAAPDATLRLPLDDLIAQGDSTVHRGVVAALGKRWRGKIVWALLDERLTGWAAQQLLQSIAAAGARPVLVGAAGPGQAVRHWPDERPPEELPAGVVVQGAESVPADVYAVVLELNADGAAVVLAREGGGMMRRPCGLDRARCAARVSDIVAARPDLATVTMDFGPAVSLGSLAAWVEALRDACVRDDEGSCIAERSPAIAVLWVRRGGAEWTDGDGDPARAGEPPVPVRLPELRRELGERPGVVTAPSRVPSPAGAEPAVDSVAPSAAGAGLDLRGLAAPVETR